MNNEKHSVRKGEKTLKKTKAREKIRNSEEDKHDL